MFGVMLVRGYCINVPFPCQCLFDMVFYVTDWDAHSSSRRVFRPLKNIIH